MLGIGIGEKSEERMMRDIETLPTFIIIGAPKCGTTTMHRFLNAHPQVCMSRIKEPRFFSHQRPWARGWEWYRSLFEITPDTLAVGEATTDYSLVTKYPTVADKIAEHLPGVRIIYMVRHPFRRIESQWIMGRANGGITNGSFADAVRESNEFIEASCYWQQVSYYRELLGDDNILVVFLEDLKHHQRHEIDRCLRHVGVDPARYPDSPPPPATKPRADRRIDGTLVRRLRSKPIFRFIRDLSPQVVRSLGRRAFTTAGNIRPEWNQDLYDQVNEQVRPDARQFLRWCEKPDEFWEWPTDVSEVNELVLAG